MIDQGFDLTGARFENFVRHDSARQLSHEQSMAANAALVATLPPTLSRNDLGLPWRACIHHARIIDARALAPESPADDIQGLDEMLSQVRIAAHIGPRS